MIDKYTKERSPIVAVVVLNWNNAPDTIECLESVSQLTYKNIRILVVDNGSTDNSVEEIRSKFPFIDILETHENLGYAEGNNFGIRYAMQGKPEYVFVLNNDTLLESTMMSKLVQAAEKDSCIGMVGPTMFCIEPQEALFAAGSFVLWNEGSLNHRGMFELPGPYVGSDKPQPVDFIVGCGLLVRRELIEEIGMLDANYYLNYEDVEWGIRAHRFGYQVLYVPQAVMWHKVSATLGQASPANTYYMTRNALRFFMLHGSSIQRWVTVGRIIFRTIRTIGAWTLKPKYRDQNFQRKRNANLLALRDFFYGRYGAMGPDVAQVCYGKN